MDRASGSTLEYDVVVAGGGPAGAVAALVLARHGRKVLLADATDSAGAPLGETLPAAARPLLRDLDLWERVQADSGHVPCLGHRSAWGSTSLHETDFLGDPNGHGMHLDRARFDARLRDEACGAGAAVVEGTRVASVARSAGREGFRVSLVAGRLEREVHCRALIDATGRRSAIGQQLGASRQREDALVRISAVFHVPNGARTDRDTRTLIEAVPEGWWTTSLLPSKERFVAFVSDADLVPAEITTGQQFLAMLDRTQHVWAHLNVHGYALKSAPRIASAHGGRLDPFAGEGWLATGDAALSFDPLASQGVLMALFTGMAGGQAMHAHLSGQRGALARYGQRLAMIRENYRRNRTSWYELEGRFADRPFWRRRRESAVAVDMVETRAVGT